jgi:hypothetical protein
MRPDRINIIANVFQRLAFEKKESLDLLKKEYEQIGREDFLWHYLLVSFSTMGNSRGYLGLIKNINNYKKVTFDVLSRMNESQRLKQIEQTLRDAKVRMPAQKAHWLGNNFDRIVKMGGLLTAKKALFAQSGRQNKIKFNAYCFSSA